MNQQNDLIDFFKRKKPKNTARWHSSTKELILPDIIKGRGSNGFQVLVADYWNSLPSSIRFLPSLSRFKNALFKHLLTKECKVVSGRSSV